jgi:uncharacterized membrane protein YphA (DoxX/SURF4 family)
MQTKGLFQYLIHFSRILAGTVFIYSGFVKGIDPLGSAYKFTDYFVAFNMEFLEPLALPLSFALSAAELLIGIALISGIHMFITSWALLLFMSFFTILTFIIALTDPVSDCGCFGDAIILTNWETFWKNIILMAFVLLVFLNRKRYRRFFKNPKYEWYTLAGILIIILWTFSWSYRNLPVVDYRPFSIGSDINEKMSVPPDAPSDEYEITLYYEKDGETRPFSVDSLPGSDWEWVRTESTLISKGYEPEITDLYIESVDDGSDYTYNVLDNPGYTFILVSYNLKNSSEKNLDRINQIAEWSYGNGIDFICLTASPVQEIYDFAARTGASYSFYHSDEITLKTIIRSNPGLLLIKEGTILSKWHYRNIPHADELKGNLLSYSLGIQQKSANKLITYAYILALLLMISLLRVIRNRVNRA